MDAQALHPMAGPGGSPCPGTLADAIGRLLPAGVHCAAGAIAAAQHFLYPAEAAVIRAAAPIRQREFRAGRSYARQALARLPLGGLPIPSAPSRAPCWPDAAVGSITHTETMAAAIAAWRSDYAGVGLDMEANLPLAQELVPMVCRADELQAAAVAGSPQGVDIGKLLFVIKEAVYKAYHPMTGRFLDFHDLSVRLTSVDRYEARIARGHPAIGGQRSFQGRMGAADGMLFALLTLRA